MRFRNNRAKCGSCKTKMISFSCTFYAYLSYLMANVVIHYISSCKVLWRLLTRQFITFRRKLYRQFCANRIRNEFIFSSSLWIHNCAFEISFVFKWYWKNWLKHFRVYFHYILVFSQWTWMYYINFIYLINLVLYLIMLIFRYYKLKYFRFSVLS